MSCYIHMLGRGLIGTLVLGFGLLSGSTCLARSKQFLITAETCPEWLQVRVSPSTKTPMLDYEMSALSTHLAVERTSVFINVADSSGAMLDCSLELDTHEKDHIKWSFRMSPEHAHLSKLVIEEVFDPNLVSAVTFWEVDLGSFVKTGESAEHPSKK
jgi:hypothetical protein